MYFSGFFKFFFIKYEHLEHILKCFKLGKGDSNNDILMKSEYQICRVLLKHFIFLMRHPLNHSH